MLTIASARALILAVQGLLTTPSHPAQKDDVLQVIRRMGLLQIDTISVVARSPYLTLFSRLGEYHPGWLDELLAEGALFEYWSHAACFIPVEDYGLHRRAMLEKKADGKIPTVWHNAIAHPELIEEVRDRITREGALRSADFERVGRPASGWWNWKEEKRILEWLFDCGDLMVSRRQSFQRVYDLRERVLPAWDDAHTPESTEIIRKKVLKTVLCLGIARPEWVADYYRLPKTGIPALLRALAAEGELLVESVEGWEEPCYVHPQQAGWLEKARRGELIPTHTTLLSPFDPLVWDRRRARQLFGFDYSIEAYLPASKRQHGYFSLPLLHRGALIARVDAKAHRKDRIFEIRNLVYESEYSTDAAVQKEVHLAIQRCADWHRCPEIRYNTPTSFQGE